MDVLNTHTKYMNIEKRDAINAIKAICSMFLFSKSSGSVSNLVAFCVGELRC